MNSKILILDIDGVMIAYPEGPGRRPDFFTPSCVRALCFLLSSDPEIKIVFSTTMKSNPRDCSTLLRMWSSAKLPDDRIIGNTPDSGSLYGNREAEVKEFIKVNHTSKCIAVDDEILFDVGYFKVNAFEGFTIDQAHEILLVFNGQKVTKMNGRECGLGWSYISNPTKYL